MGKKAKKESNMYLAGDMYLKNTVICLFSKDAYVFSYTLKFM